MFCYEIFFLFSYKKLKKKRLIQSLSLLPLFSSSSVRNKMSSFDLTPRLQKGRPPQNKDYHLWLFRFKNKLYTDDKKVYNPKTGKWLLDIVSINESGVVNVKVNPDYEPIHYLPFQVEKRETTPDGKEVVKTIDWVDTEFYYENGAIHCKQYPELWMPYEI